jgi:Do/DeqQ family serine protease
MTALALGFIAGNAWFRDRGTELGGDASREARRVVVEVAPPPPTPAYLDEGDNDGDDLPDVGSTSNAFKSAAARVRDAVVYIQVTVHTVETDESVLDRFGERMFRDRILPRSVGSGVVISSDGFIVTNNHVVEGARAIQVTLADKRVFDAELVGVDPTTDLAVIRVSEDELPNVVIGNSDLVDVGEWVLAVGNPFRLRSTVTAGIVSAVGRDVNIIEDGSAIEDFIQTDAAINPGNSGGALVNLRGELIGINTAIATESGNNEGYGFAVPSNLVTRVVADLIEFGEVQRGYLGVTVRSITANRASLAGLDRVTGVEIEQVAFGLAAHRAGLRAGDVVLAINGRDIDEPNQLQSAVARRKPGETLKIRYWRNANAFELDVTIQGEGDPATGRWLARQLGPRPTPRLEERPPESPDGSPDGSPGASPDGLRPGAPGESPHGSRGDGDAPHEMFSALGLVAGPLNGALAEGFDVERGLYVVDVTEGGPASAVGLRPDVVILTVEGIAVETTEALRALLEEQQKKMSDEQGEQDGRSRETRAEVLIEVVRRDGGHLFYSVPLG